MAAGRRRWPSLPPPSSHPSSYDSSYSDAPVRGRQPLRLRWPSSSATTLGGQGDLPCNGEVRGLAGLLSPAPLQRIWPVDLGLDSIWCGEINSCFSFDFFTDPNVETFLFHSNSCEVISKLLKFVWILYFYLNL
jgi:hypothetical protein